jgi:hypothetical protein
VFFWRPEGRICFSALSSFQRPPAFFGWWPHITTTCASVVTFLSSTLTLLSPCYNDLHNYIRPSQHNLSQIKIINLIIFTKSLLSVKAIYLQVLGIRL